MRSNGEMIQAYNCQAVVDGDHQVVVAVGVSNQPPDVEHLLPMLERTIANTGAIPKTLPIQPADTTSISGWRGQGGPSVLQYGSSGLFWFQATNSWLQIIRWETSLDAMSETRLQDEYNKAVRSCDIFLSLFKTKTGKYPEEEFDVAHAAFKDKKRPLQDIPRSVRVGSIAMVQQEVQLSGVSVRDNLTLWNRAMPQERVEVACRDAKILADIQPNHDCPPPERPQACGPDPGAWAGQVVQQGSHGELLQDASGT